MADGHIELPGEGGPCPIEHPVHMPLRGVGDHLGKVQLALGEVANKVRHRAEALEGLSLQPGLVLTHMRVPNVEAQVITDHGVAPEVVLAAPFDRLRAEVGGEGKVSDHATRASLALRWNLAGDGPLHTDERPIKSDLMGVLND